MIKPVIQFSIFSGVIILRHFSDHQFPNLTTVSPNHEVFWGRFVFTTVTMGAQKIGMENRHFMQLFSSAGEGEKTTYGSLWSSMKRYLLEQEVSVLGTLAQQQLCFSAFAAESPFWLVEAENVSISITE